MLNKPNSDALTSKYPDLLEPASEQDASLLRLIGHLDIVAISTIIPSYLTDAIVSAAQAEYALSLHETEAGAIESHSTLVPVPIRVARTSPIVRSDERKGVELGVKRAGNNWWRRLQSAPKSQQVIPDPRRSFGMMFVVLLLLVFGSVVVATIARSGVLPGKNSTSPARATPYAAIHAPISKTLELLPAMKPLYHIDDNLALRDITFGGPGQIVHAGWSPDGTLFAVGRLDTVEVWEAISGQLIYSTTLPYLRGSDTNSPNYVGNMEWSPISNMLAVENYDNAILLIDPIGKRIVNSMEGPVAAKGTSPLFIMVKALAWSPDGRMVASADRNPVVIHLWDAATGGVARDIPVQTTGGAVSEVGWSADGTLLAAATQYGTDIHIYDPAAGVELRQTDGYSFSWSPNGNSLAVVKDRIVRIEDAVSGNVVSTLPAGDLPPIPPFPISTLEPGIATPTPVPAESAPYRNVYEVLWSPVDNLLATYDATLRLWDTQTGALKRALGDGHWGYALSWSPDGRVLAVASADLTFLDPVTGNVLSTLSPDSQSKASTVLVWSPNGQYLLSIADSRITMWGVPQSEELSGW